MSSSQQQPQSQSQSRRLATKQQPQRQRGGGGNRKGSGGGKKAASSSSPAEDQFMAAAIGDVEWLRQSLKESGAPGQFDRNGLAAVHLAAIHGRLECLRLLIEQFKCDVNSASATGWRPVHLCISGQTGPRSLQCLLYLLDKGAEHSCLNDDKVTPVHQAASEGHLQALQLLMKLGAKLDQPDVRGFRPIDMAKIWGHRKCARLLATETWHRDKDQLAKKLHMEKRVTMKELLRQFEQEEQVAGYMKYQGNEAFNEWVQQVEESKYSHQKHHRKATTPQPPPQATSQKPPPPPPPKSTAQHQKQDGRTSPAERYRQPTATGGDTSADDLQARVREAINEADEVLAETAPSSAKAAAQRSPALRLAWHPQGWNHSTKAADCFHPYQRVLEDAYPRDSYTRMPHPLNSYPLRLNALSGHPEAALAGDTDRREMREVGRQRRGEGDGEGEGDGVEVAEQQQEEDEATAASPQRQQQLRLQLQRQQLFSCKSVLDIQRRGGLAEATRKHRGEAAAHLSSDIRSFLFRDAVGLLMDPAEDAAAAAVAPAVASDNASRRSKSTTSSSASRPRTPSRLLTPQLKVV